MADDIEDPAANTQMFQAFMDRPREPEPSGSRAVLVVVVLAALAVVLAVAWFVVG